MNHSELLRISIWDDSRLRAFGESLKGSGTVVTFGDREQAERRLLAGLEDLALVPSDRVIASLDDFDVLPAVAYSSWNTPHATIALVDGLSGSPETLGCADPGSLEALVGRIVLREHYGMSVQLSPSDGQADESGEAAVLAVDEPPPRLQEANLLDLGREWHELTNYPMVWGMFVMRKGEANAAVVRLLRDAAASVETADELDGTEPGADGMGLPRFRYDDLATASLTDLCSYLYYYGLTQDIAVIEPATVPDGEDPGEDDREPLL